MKHYISLLLVAFIAPSLFAFDLSNSLVPEKEILSGGPPKDGIPAIMNPKFLSARKVRFLKMSDIVIGVRIGKITKAYPIRILNWHEVVNDSIGKTPIAVTF